MKTGKTQPLYPKSADMKKNFRFITVAFFILGLFVSLLSLQSFSILPLWLKISIILILIGYVGLFVHGFTLIKQFKFDNWLKYGRFILLFLVILSVQLLLTSNAMFIAGVKENVINEQANFLQFTFLLYLAAAVVFFILSLFISSPQLRKVNSQKAYVIGSISAVVVIAIVFVILNMVKGAVFTNPDTVATAYQFFMASVLALFPATVLGTSMKRGGSKK
ncbi:hypothetical protein AM500_05345 [Bacillus sp. FJAT-18017]|uniref:hypothetical protein n=1 Tax=Bacillus sp. FJAT-18017 TaxID=1705566 RepID=UPI0006AEAB1D|nr:hypothetical protein [Bacillus sp. FJAT-18017]ALC89274.1 hypothetical protein AM500_05345 [Bacillus sp. FJAT-18017]